MTNGNLRAGQFITFTIIASLDFAHRPELEILENTTFRKLDVYPSSGEERKTRTLLGPSKRANLNDWTNHLKSSQVILRPTVSRCQAPLSDPRPNFPSFSIYF
jgi:hypothetical protein